MPQAIQILTLAVVVFRGYLYQAFVATLKALTLETWDNIYVELDTDNDKVDIALESENKMHKTIQVKSSIYLFKKADIQKWLIDLIGDKPSQGYASPIFL